ncbi:MAG TPA: FMN-binding negative transcriptional regulator [bacterium]
MYIPKNFEMKDPNIIRDFLNSNGFGLLISNPKDDLTATHLPFLYEAQEGGKGTLYTHVARNNPQWQSLSPDKKVLTVFSGPHGYISPRWYSSIPAVPTWDYVAIHIYAYPELIEDKEKVYGLLDKTSNFYENQNGTDWKLDLTSEYYQRLTNSIVGIKLKIIEIQASFKLSQNKSSEDRNKVIVALENKGTSKSIELGELIKKYSIPK